MIYELSDSVDVTADAATTWDFFSKAENLPRITPPWMKFSVKTPPPIEMHSGTLIDYTVHWLGIPLKWRTRIIDWSPPRQFIDLQLRGPYTLWHHQHTFTPIPDSEGGGTRCTDRVLYKLPMGWPGRIAHPIIVKRQLLGIFNYRREAIAKILGIRGVAASPQIRALG